ncbi:hypothetical protein TrispH2_009722 [Trichoplax sp. H2]|uniref:N-acetyltransferase domain-containing protein n=1 Tax=Trichoplax adhaerens TaxID=10228 RepID=B3SBF2_TRIAD|nr:hypothetical protein TRIADDRAFT_61594 [Trichoplax adhaerens]EDV19944.1 hypothetical protein TRIADDRAFT_61594 [Trichoplax adhaerens]RDD38349.1 hypothetical protein TrispH2_009722 [Trichoplax sp. H2]|eukprot:XP_002117534.1 hypothetical protein TRIADDRAFT_61594 [Trichoplax adhaerens]
MSQDSNFEIVTATINQMKWIISMAKDEGWNPGEDDFVFQLADPTGYFIGLLNGEPICCISATKYNIQAEMGYYVVKKEHRGLGYGRAIMQHSLKYLKGYNILIYALQHKIGTYETIGFKKHEAMIRYAGIIAKKEVISDNIYSARDIPLDKIVEYDARYFAEERKKFLSAWLMIGTANSFVYKIGDNIRGLGAIRKAQDGYRIGPLYAETPDIAITLFHRLCQDYENCKITVECPASNADAKELVKKFKLDKVFQGSTMYSGELPKVNLNHIYGVITH